MSFIQPIPCDDGGGGDSVSCCPSVFTGYCLDDGTPLAITIVNGVQTTWTNLLTGVVTPGPPPAGTGICPTAVVEVQFQPLTCETDAVTVCQGVAAWVVSAVDLDIRNLNSATDSITVIQGTSPWAISGTVDLGIATLTALETITVLQGTSPWVVSGTVELGPISLAALESITVVQGTSPWVVSGTVALDAPTLAALENITVQQGTSPWVVSGTVALDAPTLAALETITVLQGTNPWTITGTITPASSVISTLNSSSTPLAGGGAFIGTFENTLPYVEGAVMVVTDQVSAIDGLRMEQSIDGVTFADVDVYTIPANNGKQYTFALNARFFRVTYTNGATPQTRFELATIFRRTAAKPSSHRINDTIITEDDAELVKSVLSGQIPGGAFVNIGAEASGYIHSHDEADYAEDAPSVDGSLGQAVLGVRNDIGVAKTTTDGDYTFFATDAAGRIGIADLGGSITIDGAVTANTNFDFPEDTPHISGDIGAFVLAVRNDAGTPLAADGDYIPFTTDATGAIRVNAGTTVTQIGRDDTDNQAAVATGLLTSVDRNYIWDSVGGNWDRWTGAVTQGTSPWVVSGTVTVNQGTSPWVIGDGGGSITVDGTVTVTQGTSPWAVSGTVAATQSGSWSVTILNGAGAAAVNIQDGGNSITVDGTVSISGSVTTADNKIEDVPHVSGDTGSFVLAVRNDANTAFTNTNGDYSPIAVNANGAVAINDGGNSITVDGTVAISGTVAVTQSTSPWVVSGTVTVNQGTSPWVTSLDATTLAALESITVQNPGGASAVNIQDGGNSITVDGAVTVSGTIATNSERAEDSGHTSGQIGNFVLGVRNDTASTLTSTDLDYTPFATDAAGRIGISDLGGSISIDDNGGSITVDGTVAATQSGAWSVTILNGAGAAAVNIQDGGNSITVDGTVSISGTVTVDTELPTASALADADPNPTTSRIGANNLVFNGTTWDRVRAGTATGSILINNPTAANFLATVTIDAASLAALESITVQNPGGVSAVNIQDGGNSITVDGTVSISGTVTVDTNFDYAEDVPHVSGDVGAFVLAVRNDANAAFTNTNGDYSPIAVNSAGAVAINDGGNSITVDGAVSATQGTSPWVVSGTVAATQSGSWSVTILNGAGAAAVNIQDGGNSITVDGTVSISGTVAVTQSTSPWVVSGTVATNSERAEDSGHTSGQIGNFVLGVRNDTASVLTSTDLDYTPFATDSAGRIGISDLGGAISIDDNGGSITIDGTVAVSGTVAVTQSTSPWVVSGTVAATQSGAWSTTNINGAGAAAVNIQDGGNSITVDGTVAATQSGAWSVTNLNGAGAAAVNIQDGGNSITVDGTVTITQPTGTITNGAETAVSTIAVQILASNANRKKYFIQNTGAANIRVGVSGVTATTGVRLVPSGTILMEMPNCPTQAIFAIREGSIDSIAFAQEVT